MRADLRGLPGRPPVTGYACLDALANARVALSICRPHTVHRFASDRMIQSLGNGLDFFARHDHARRRVAEANWRAAHSMFASQRVAKYILERSFDESLSETYPWPTAIETTAQSSQPASARGSGPS